MDAFIQSVTPNLTGATVATNLKRHVQDVKRLSAAPHFKCKVIPASSTRNNLKPLEECGCFCQSHSCSRVFTLLDSSLGVCRFTGPYFVDEIALAFSF